jgi:membrane associated rhomboid family serine protease
MYRFGRAEMISTGSTFLDGVLGFGIAAVLLPGASGTWFGILVAAFLLALSGIVIDAGMRLTPDPDSQEAQDSPVDVALLWFVATMIWLVAAVPACALVAPDYELRGFTANLGAWVTVMSVGWLTTWARRLR